MSYILDIYTFSYSLTRLIVMISSMRLCTSENYIRSCISILNIAELVFSACTNKAVSFHFTVSVILEFNPSFQIGHSIYSLGAWLIFKHKKQPLTAVQVSCLKRTFKQIIDYTAQYTTFIAYEPALIMLDLIKEFDEEPYFDEMRNYVIQKCLPLLKFCAVFGVVAEISHCQKNSIKIPSELRKFLLNVKLWYSSNESTLYLMRQEHQAVLLQVQRYFNSGPLLTDLVVFSSSCYFIETSQESPFFSVHIFTQLAK
jgi:hypothetical protein